MLNPRPRTSWLLVVELVVMLVVIIWAD